VPYSLNSPSIAIKVLRRHSTRIDGLEHALRLDALEEHVSDLHVAARGQHGIITRKLDPFHRYRCTIQRTPRHRNLRRDKERPIATLGLHEGGKHLGRMHGELLGRLEQRIRINPFSQALGKNLPSAAVANREQERRHEEKAHIQSKAGPPPRRYPHGASEGHLQAFHSPHSNDDRQDRKQIFGRRNHSLQEEARLRHIILVDRFILASLQVTSSASFHAFCRDPSIHLQLGEVIRVDRRSDGPSHRRHAAPPDERSQ
jgi:hypothetical protein